MRFGFAPSQATTAVLEPQIPIMDRAKETIAKLPVHDRGEMVAEISHLEDKKQKLLAVEGGAQAQIHRRIVELHALVMREDMREQLGDLPQLDPVVLKWRHNETIAGHKIALPSLVLFALDRPTVEASISWSGRATWTPDVPRFLNGTYDDVTAAAAAIISRNDVNRSDVTLTATFAGVIPEETKEKIKAAEDQFEEIRLLTEVPSWTTKLSTMPDPIVVGVGANALWVIDVFDPTPVEEYVASEFTT